MTLPIPLAVRLSNSDADRHITKELRSLSFRSAMPGGFASATFALDRPLAQDAPELAYFTRVYIYDGRNGNVVWEGRLEDPGRGVGDDGQVWEIAAIGPLTHLKDDVRQLYYVDTSNERWKRSAFGTQPNAQTFDRTQHDTNDDNDQPALLLGWKEGSSCTSVTPQSRVDVIYRALYYAGLKLGWASFKVVNGVSTSNRENQLVARIGPSGAGALVGNPDWSTTETVLGVSKDTDFPATAYDVISTRIAAVAGGAFTAGETAYGEFYELTVQQQRKSKAGADLTTGHTDTWVLPHQVVEDVVGRMLPQIDGANATVDSSSSYHIDQLVYPQGANAETVLDDVTGLLNGTHTYAVWESNDAGKYRFEFTLKPTTVRYQASPVDGFSVPGSAGELYNKAAVHYIDWQNRDRQVFVTQAVPELDNNGITRTLQVDVGDEVSSQANAVQYGTQQLADYAKPRAGGTLTIARPIVDMTTGMMIQPWEILPGQLIRVTGVGSTGDPLNATTRDGQTVFYIVSVEYNVDSASSTLELDSYSRSLARDVAKLNRLRRRLR